MTSCAECSPGVFELNAERMTEPVLTWRYKGRKVPIAQLAREHGLNPRTLVSRLRRGVPISEALKPARRYRKKGGRKRKRKPKQLANVPEFLNSAAGLLIESQSMLREINSAPARRLLGEIAQWMRRLAMARSS